MLRLRALEKRGDALGERADEPPQESMEDPMAESALLSVTGLSTQVGEKPILHGVDLTVNPGEVHVLMGPNGAGKSTLGKTIMGDPTYEVTSGSIEFAGQDVTALSADKRSLAGIFMSYQAPVEVPGVPLYQFLRTITRKHPGPRMSGSKFRAHVGELCDQLSLNQSNLVRDLNVGFSGGERKKVEMLQLLLLQPKLAILDETDSGLDVDAMRIVADGVNKMHTPETSAIVITHYERLLDMIKPDVVHVLYQGRIVKTAGSELAKEIEQRGYDWIKAEIEE